MKSRHLNVAAICLLVALPSLLAQDVYYAVDLEDVAFPEKAPTKPAVREESTSRMGSSRRTQKEQAMQPYAIGNGEEIYVGVNQEGRRSPWFVRDTTALNMAGTRLFVRSDSVRPVEGMLFLPRSDWSGMEAYRFRLPPSSGNRQEAKAAFYQAKEAHYEGLLARNIPGAAWFRHQRDQLALPVETDTSGRRR